MGVNYNGRLKNPNGLKHIYITPTSITWVTAASLPAALGDEVISIALVASIIGAVGQTTYQVVDGTLPSGLSLDPSTGVLSGTVANENVNASFTVRVTNNKIAAERTFTMAVDKDDAPVWVTSANLGSGITGNAYSSTFVATDPEGAQITFSHEGGSIPAGLTFNAETGVLSGTLTTIASYSFTIRATDPRGYYNDRVFTFETQQNPDLVDPFIANVAGLFHLDGNLTNSRGGWTANSFSAAFSGAQSKFGGNALSSGGFWISESSSGLVVGNGSGTTTVEAWVYPTTGGTVVRRGSRDSSNNTLFTIVVASNGNVTASGYYNGSTLSVTAAGGAPMNQWSHLAVVQTTNNIRLFVNGVYAGNTYYAGLGNGDRLTFGYGWSYWFGNVMAGTQFGGFIDDVRITNAARYTGAFTPSSLPFPNS